MRPHPRIRKAIKWGGPVVALSVATLLLLSTRSVMLYTVREDDMIALYAGRAQLLVNYGDGLSTNETGFMFYLRQSDIEWLPSLLTGTNGYILSVPLWLPFVLITLPTALAWRLDTIATRRAKLGACPTCSYPRTGLAPSSPCPECGKECAATVPPPASG
ncbi:MAG TPA: hypothetical protein VHN77_09380 [Phycisphaerales bacterium]|nr:hypothetical protein [Phycisphaerales bacterium]